MEELKDINKTPKGKQVANNRERQSRLTLHYTDNTNEVYFTDVPLPYEKLIRREYTPLGNMLQYPTKWGKKKAITHFIQWYLKEHTESIKQLTKRVEDFTRYLESDEYNELPDGVLPKGVVDFKRIPK